MNSPNFAAEHDAPTVSDHLKAALARSPAPTVHLDPLRPQLASSSSVCPACDGPIGNTLFTCHPCWTQIPPRDRAQLRQMYVNKQPVDTKLAKCVRIIRAKRAAA